MDDGRHCFWAGVRDCSPLLVGMAPFGLICGAVCVNAGMPVWAALGFSTIIFAGASQLAAVQLMADHASLAVVVLTGLVINARFLMYSASIAPHFRGTPPARKGLIAYLLTDQAYALSIARFGRGGDGLSERILYFLGVALTVWTCFCATAWAGAVLGAFIPPSWDLGFAIPLTFIAVVVPAIRDRPTVLAAAAAGTTAVLASGLPYNLGLLVGAVTGILTGYLAERRLNRG
ncbi:AzlC family ABC transporter permease [Pseudodesulfovibrio indicus]|uniref:AzlC family ABC transporter permease n=1 Tax=Pseudodesulfovibrio indicus TaxID=1716143 RepID=UPI00292EFA7E|nr:AzlC family ABC transporter permease [Pseudodesulfovibrio indicus]